MAIRDLKRGLTSPSQQHGRNSDAPSAVQRYYVTLGGKRHLVKIAVPFEEVDVSECDQDAPLMSQFLDLLSKDIDENPSKLVPYTEEMSKRYRSLIAGVLLDE